MSLSCLWSQLLISSLCLFLLAYICLTPAFIARPFLISQCFPPALVNAALHGETSIIYLWSGIVCSVGLSNILLSCAAKIQNLIPSHMQRMKDDPWILLWSPNLNTDKSKPRKEWGGEQRGFLQLSVLYYKLQREQSLFYIHGFFLYGCSCPHICLFAPILSLAQFCITGFAAGKLGPAKQE